MLTEKEIHDIVIETMNKKSLEPHGFTTVYGEDYVKATEQALLAKLQPEGMDKTKLYPTKEEIKKIVRDTEMIGEFTGGGVEADEGDYVFEGAKFVIEEKLSPYLLQAEEEGDKRINKAIEILELAQGEWLGVEVPYAPAQYTPFKEAIQELQALSSPATEKENDNE